MNRRNFIRMVVGGTAAVACGVTVAAQVKLQLHGMFGTHGVKTAAHSTLATQCRSFFGNDIDCVATYPQTYQEANVSKDTLYKSLRRQYDNNYTY